MQISQTPEHGDINMTSLPESQVQHKTVLSQFLPALVHFPLRYCYNAKNINIRCLLH